jgi:hypothetical protein
MLKCRKGCGVMGLFTNKKKLIKGLLVLIFFLIYIMIFERTIHFTIGGFGSSGMVLIVSAIMIVVAAVLSILTTDKAVEVLKD